jgi:hypothetical protein
VIAEWFVGMAAPPFLSSRFRLQPQVTRAISEVAQLHDAGRDLIRFRLGKCEA